MQKYRIIFIDDEKHFLDGVKRVFHSYRNLWEFIFTTESKDVLERIGDDRDTVIISDLMMPHMNGIELCKQVRKKCAKNHNSSTYFILLSNIKDTENKTLGLESGADDYIEKPFKQDELLARVKIGVRLLEAKAELREAWKKAQQHSIAKSEALSSMSHEIRNPMNAILGMSSLLLEMNLDDEPMELVQTIYNASEGLLHLLNDVLDISKVEAEKFELDRYEFDLEELVKNVIDISKQTATQKGTKVDYSLPVEELGLLMGDAKRLRQVLINLLSNAIKFTANGYVNVMVTLEKDDASCVKLKIGVADTGIGIPKEKQHKLFQAFSQAFASTQTHYGGTGLGLALSRQIVQMMGGDMVIDSEEGKGTTFSFSVVFGKSDQKKKKAGSASPYSPVENGEHIRVLVADDNLVNQKVASMMLTKLGVQVETANDGSDVLTKMQQQFYDLILMDVEMPNLNGVEATRCIRAGGLPFKNSQPRIISLTGHAMKGDLERFLAAGMDGVITKPIRPEFLKIELEKTVAISSTKGSA